MEKKSMGSFLTALRKASGLTQKQLAEKLNVSDKAVSRWERDECAPDLSLIPVLAEIYGVTSDEILRGQRMDPEKLYHGNDKAKAQKQRQRILASTKTKFVSRSLITVAATLVGLILAYIFNFEFAKANTGFLLGCIFFIAALVCQVSFLISGFSAVTDEEWQDSCVSSCKGFMLLASQWVLGGIVTAFSFCIPLAGKHTTAVPLADCAVSGIKWALVVMAVMVALSLLVNGLLKRRGVVDLKLPLNRLRVRCSTVLSLVMLVLLGLQIGLNGFLTTNRHLYAPYDTCNSLYSFKTLMAQPISPEGYHMTQGDSWEDTYAFSVVHNYGLGSINFDGIQYIFFKDEITKQLLPSDMEPGQNDNAFTREFGYQFQHLNLHVPYYEISGGEEIVPIYTFNTEQLEEANTILIYINLACLSLYLLAAVVTGIVYFLRQKKL